VEEILPDWQVFETGIEYFAGRVRKPRLKFWALRIDLTDPTIGFAVNKPEAVNGVFQDGVIPSVKVTSFTERYACLAGINANPFDPASDKEEEPRKIVGIAVSQGLVVSDPNPAYDALVFYSDGQAEIRSQKNLNPAKIENAVGGFRIVLKNGAVADRLLAPKKEPRYPRSAAGLSGDGNFLYLLVVDGRQPGSVGATEREIANILKRLGASEGLNFDGGGSTALALRQADGKVRTVNTPIHGGIPHRQRGVGTCLGIVRRNSTP
jgi:exopolysaccharide biosynthesis protein